MNLWMNNAVSAQLNSAWVSAYQPESEAIFAAMTPTPDIPRKLLIDQMVVTLKTGGVWGTLDCLHVFVSHSYAAGVINWADPAGPYIATLEGAAAWTVDDCFASASSARAGIVTAFTPANGVKFAGHRNNEMGYYLSKAPTTPTGASAARPLMGVTNQVYVPGATLDTHLAGGAEYWLACRRARNKLQAYPGLSAGALTGINIANDLGLFSVSNSSYDSAINHGVQVWQQGQITNAIDGLLSPEPTYDKPYNPVALGAISMDNTPPDIVFSSNSEFRLYYAGAKLTIAQRQIIANALETFYAGV